MVYAKMVNRIFSRTLEMLFAAHTLGACLPLCEVPQQISWNFLKMYLLCMN